jgi:hypothetical protein
MRRLIGLMLLTAALAATPGTASASLGAPGQRIDLKVLLISETGVEPSLDAWKKALELEGVPYDSRRVGGGQPALTAGQLSTGNRASYQAVVFATSGVYAALTAAELAALETFESTFGIRQVTAYAYPSAQFGLESPFSAGPMFNEVGTLTTAGRAVFRYLKGPVPFAAEAWGYRAVPCAGCPGRFEVLVSGNGGAALVGMRTHPDGRQELVMTVDSNPWMIHSQLLRHGLLDWVTKGVYFGHWRNYIGLHIDDAFYPDERWNAELNCTPDPPTPECPEIPPIRMTAADVTRAVNWMTAKNVRLTLAYNAEGADPADPLTAALLQRKGRFDWINHTWSHEHLDAAPLSLLKSEIRQNIDWARTNKVAIDRDELVTGEHSGLANPSMPQALAETGISWIAADASRQPDQYLIGSARTVPRWPANVFYNTSTRSDQLDEYNYIYLPPELGGSCQNTATTTCRSAPITWSEYVDLEAGIMLQHVLANDPRPHFFHQSNLAEDGILYDVVGRVVDRYRQYVSVALNQPAFNTAGATLRRRGRWQATLAAGQVSGWIQDGKVFVQAAATTDVPLAGTTVGGAYGGQTSGWTTVSRGTTTSFALAARTDPLNTAPPTISGAPTTGGTLTATTGTWSGATPITYSYAWQRCEAGGGSCTNVPGAVSASYTVATSDVGSTLRVVVTAANGAGSGTGISAATSPVAEGPVNTSPPTVSGTAQEGQTLTGSSGTWTGTPPITFAYQWQRWGPGPDPAGPWQWADIAGATVQTYVPGAEDVDRQLRIVVTGTNGGGSASASSESTAPVAAAGPANTSPPSISGTAQVGQTLTAAPGSWTGAGTITYAFQWQRWGPGPDPEGPWQWGDIDEATQETYVPSADDAGRPLRVVVAAADSTGSRTAASAATEPVAP